MFLFLPASRKRPTTRVVYCDYKANVPKKHREDSNEGRALARVAPLDFDDKLGLASCGVGGTGFPHSAAFQLAFVYSLCAFMSDLGFHWGCP